MYWPKKSQPKWSDEWYGQYYYDQPKGAGKHKKDKQPKEAAKIRAYDGAKIDLPSQPSQPSSLSSSSASSNQADINELKKFMVEFAKQQGTTGHPVIQQLMEDASKNKLNEEQKALNQKRKLQKKMESLKKQILSKEEAFGSWRASMKALIKSEDERHSKNMEALKQELEKIQKMEASAEDLEEESKQDSSSDEEMKEMPMSRANRELQKQLAESDNRCRQMQANNFAMQQQMQEMLQAVHATMGGIDVNLTPYVSSPAGLRGRSALTPFGKSPKVNQRSSPYGNPKEPEIGLPDPPEPDGKDENGDKAEESKERTPMVETLE